MHPEESANARRRRQSGQALVEFVVMFPVILGFVWYLIKVQMAINTSLVGQKHARSQVFLKALNHRDYPVESEYKANPGRRSVFWLAVGADPIKDLGEVQSPAPLVDLGVGLKPKQLPGARDDIGEPDSSTLRQRVRIRTAFGMCTSRKPNPDGSLGDYCGEVDR